MEVSTTVKARQALRLKQAITRHEEIRRRSGYTVTALARAASYSHPYVSRVESRDIPASAKYRLAVSGLLGVPEDLIFDEGGWAA
jgi:transcriptional regulator with XRE-family HTH domain